RHPGAALGQYLGGGEAEAAGGARHDGAPAADVGEARGHCCGVDAHPARTSTFIASSGLSIANAIAAGASSSAYSCVISASPHSRRRATSATASAKSSALQVLTPSTSSSRNGSVPTRR